MKQLRLTFEDNDFKLLKKLKKGLSWNNFIMLMGVHCEESVKRGDLEIFKQKKENTK